MGGKGLNWRTIIKIWKENAENMIDPFTAERMKSVYYPMYTHSKRPSALHSSHNLVVNDKHSPVHSGYASDGSIFNQHKPCASYIRNNNINGTSSKQNKNKLQQCRNKFEQNLNISNPKNPSKQLSETQYHQPSPGSDITPTSIANNEDYLRKSTDTNKTNASWKSSISASSAASGTLSENKPANENDVQHERERKYFEDKDNLSINSDELLFNSPSFQRISAAVNNLLPPRPSEPPKPKKKEVKEPSSDSPPKYLDCSSRSICGCDAYTCSGINIPTKEEIKQAKEKAKCKCRHKINENLNEELNFITDLVNIEKKIRAVTFRPDKTKIQKIYNTHLTNKHLKEKRKLLNEYKQRKKEKIKKRFETDCEFSCCLNSSPEKKITCSLRKCNKKCKDFSMDDEIPVNAIDPYNETGIDEKLKRCRKKDCTYNEVTTCKRGKAAKNCKNKYQTNTICDPPCSVYKTKDVYGSVNYLQSEISSSDETIDINEEDEVMKTLGLPGESNNSQPSLESSETSSSSDETSTSEGSESEDNTKCTDCADRYYIYN